MHLLPQVGARAPELCGCLTCAQASQPKFHDLHLDAFRMLQALEWQPSALHKDVPKPPPTSRQASDGAEAGAGAAGASAAAAGSVGAGAAERANPHKYVLQRATAAQLTLVLATAMVELPPRGLTAAPNASATRNPSPQPPIPTRPQLRPDPQSQLFPPRSLPRRATALPFVRRAAHSRHGQGAHGQGGTRGRRRRPRWRWY